MKAISSRTKEPNMPYSMTVFEHDGIIVHRTKDAVTKAAGNFVHLNGQEYETLAVHTFLNSGERRATDMAVEYINSRRQRGKGPAPDLDDDVDMPCSPTSTGPKPVTVNDIVSEMERELPFEIVVVSLEKTRTGPRYL
jgi:hypothetical protein